MVFLLYSILTGKTIDVGNIISKEMRNCADGDLYQIAGDSILQQRLEESEDLEDKEEEDPTEIESVQSAEVLNKVEPMEPEAEPDVKTSMFRAQPPCPDL
ncbi:hypothetical protein PVK06_027109 [Gossypium arboreum]|uniref:Uncharacterized protein n=1 Tax=Gossypium arboreum TaxID=29729 RepID=A0ABR0NZR3_GOSAR|nr:hypothetical protein PVK06_027109 [Gossypium arboreum]